MLRIYQILFQRIYITGVRQLKRIDSIRRSPVYVHFDETLAGTSCIRSFNREKQFIEKADQLTDESQMAFFLIQGAQRYDNSYVTSAIIMSTSSPARCASKSD